MIGCSLELFFVLTICFFILLLPQPLFRVCKRVMTGVDRFKSAHDATQDKLTVMSRKFFCVGVVFVFLADCRLMYLLTVWL